MVPNDMYGVLTRTSVFDRGLFERTWIEASGDNARVAAFSNAFAGIVERLALQATHASGFDDASVFLHTALPEARRLACGVRNTSSHNWHIDHSHEEMFSLDVHARSLTYILPLVGNTTHYYLDQTTPRDHVRRATRTEFVTGCTDECMAGHIFDPAKVISTPRGMGSVHINGLEFGAIHASPSNSDRMIVIITPGSREAINRRHAL